MVSSGASHPAGRCFISAEHHHSLRGPRLQLWGRPCRWGELLTEHPNSVWCSEQLGCSEPAPLTPHHPQSQGRLPCGRAAPKGPGRQEGPCRWLMREAQAQPSHQPGANCRLVFAWRAFVTSNKWSLTLVWYLLPGIAVKNTTPLMSW